MSDPYTPPATQEEHPGTPSSNNDVLLRRIGAIALVCQWLRILWHDLADARAQDDPIIPTILGALGGLAFVGIFIYGFLYRGNAFHLGIAIVLALSIVTQVYALNVALFYAGQITINAPTGNLWLSFVIQVAPAAIAFLCATALYLRARRTPAAG